MKELKDLRNEVLNLRNIGEITKQTEKILLNKLNALDEAITYAHSSTLLPTKEEILLMGEDYVKELNEGLFYDIDRTYDEVHFLKGCIKMREVIKSR